MRCSLILIQAIPSSWDVMITKASNENEKDLGIRTRIQILERQDGKRNSAKMVLPLSCDHFGLTTLGGQGGQGGQVFGVVWSWSCKDF